MTSSAASCLLVGALLVFEGKCDVVIVVFAALAYVNGEAVIHSGSGNDWGCCVVYHFASGAVEGAIGGQGASMIVAGDSVLLVGGLVYPLPQDLSRIEAGQREALLVGDTMLHQTLHGGLF